MLKHASSSGVRRCVVWLALAAAAGLPGCAGYYYGEKYGPTLGSLMRESLVQRNTEAVQKLLKQMAPKAAEGQPQGADAPPAMTVLVQPLHSVQGAGDGSAFARIVSEQLAGALASQGQRVLWTAHEGPQGVQPLEALLLERQAQALLSGRYAVSAGQVFVSLKLLRPDASVAAAHDYAVPLDDDVRSLLGRR